MLFTKKVFKERTIVVAKEDIKYIWMVMDYFNEDVKGIPAYHSDDTTIDVTFKMKDSRWKDMKEVLRSFKEKIGVNCAYTA